MVRSESHLVPIDAALDPAPLRARHPDRHSVEIVPAVISVSLIGRVNATPGGIETPPRLTGSLDQIPATIHVPRPFNENFQALPKDSPNVYRVHLRYGKLLDPLVTAVEFGPQ